MHWPIAVLSVILIFLVLQDAFETMLLPRRITRPFRFTKLYVQCSWQIWSAMARRVRATKRRSLLLSLYGPLSILILMGLWALGLIVGFALLHWSLDTPLNQPDETGFGVYLYMSGVIFFTLGFGDITPALPLGRFLAVSETGLGFAFLAVVISYLPILYQAFSHREVSISLLDARAGSPPTAAQLLLRLSRHHECDVLSRFLEEWERWAAEVLESHVSFPVLSFYRSQHDNQSWLAAMTVILDTSAIVISSFRDSDSYQAQLTFAMARHTVVDLAQVYQVRPVEFEIDRMPQHRLRALRAELSSAGVEIRESEASDKKLAELRRMYEPFVNALSAFLVLPLPVVAPDSTPVDNWQTSAWMRQTKGINELVPAEQGDDHTD
jgi:hypothetical protein